MVGALKMIRALVVSAHVVSAVLLHVMKIVDQSFSNVPTVKVGITQDVSNVVNCQTFQRLIYSNVITYHPKIVASQG